MLKRAFVFSMTALCLIFVTAPHYGWATPDKAGVTHPLSLHFKHAGSNSQLDDYSQMPGFPQNMGSMGFFSPMEGPIQVDIDFDGDLEIFAASTDNYLYGWHHNGSNVNGFPISTSGPIQSSPAVGDIDGDGDLEVLIANRNGNVYAYHHNGAPVTGWPQTTFDDIAINSVALWDFDEDGDLEVFIGSDRLYVWNGNGTSLPGFPVNFAGNQYGTCSSSSVGDIDGDGEPEIILEGWDYLNAFNLNGSIVAGWPYALTGAHGFSYSAPSLVDIDGDGDLEIFCASHESGGSYNSLLYGLDGDGSDLPGFPQFIQGWTYSTPAISDLDGDGEVEIALLCNSALLYAFNTDGSAVPGWPVNFGQYNCEAAVAIVDIDNNCQLDLFFGNNGGTAGYQYYCYRADGSAHPDFPFTTSGPNLPNCSAIADADGDGDFEIAHFVGNGTVYLWDAPYPAGIAMRPWAMAHHDIHHTGNFHYIGDLDVSVTLTPTGPPIVIPAIGGDFFYNVEFINNSDLAARFDAWIMVTLPSGTLYGPVLGPLSLNLPGGGTIERDRTQSVPGNAPAGQYTYSLHIGVFPVEVYSGDSFTFDKLESSEGAGYVGDWTNRGESFGEPSTDETKFPSNPSSFILHSCYPNPFNPTTAISYQLQADSYVELTIYDIQGREVARLVDGWYSAGSYETVLDGTGLSSGMYFARLTAGAHCETLKVILLK